MQTALQQQQREGLDVLLDTVGTPDSIRAGLGLLNKSGTLVLLAVHEQPAAFAPIWLSGERRTVTSSNNRYQDFPAAIDLLATGRVQAQPLITHRFRLSDAPEAFATMQAKEQRQAYKVVLTP